MALIIFSYAISLVLYFYFIVMRSYLYCLFCSCKQKSTAMRGRNRILIIDFVAPALCLLQMGVYRQRRDVLEIKQRYAGSQIV